MRASIVAASFLLVADAGVLAAQSLAEVAAAEAARRKAIATPARVITGDDLRQGPYPPGEPAPAATTGDPADALPVVRRPARLRSGAPPAIPVQAVGGGDVALELALDAAGRVTSARVLRDTPPFTSALAAAVATWQFEPAEDAASPGPGENPARVPRQRVPSRVLVLGVFRPPALFPMTIGTPPKVVDGPSEAVPNPHAPPRMPLYPPNAQFDGVVIVEHRVAASGAIAETRVVQSAPGFDQAALVASDTLSYRPARVNGRPSPAFVYIVSGFRQPVTP
jgi:outer membrane biosynthesis protein TonB